MSSFAALPKRGWQCQTCHRAVGPGRQDCYACERKATAITQVLPAHQKVVPMAGQMIDLHTMKAWGTHLEIADEIRASTVVLVWSEPIMDISAIRMSKHTSEWLCVLEKQGGRNWHQVQQMVVTAEQYCEVDRKSKVVDLGTLNIVTPKPRPKRVNPDPVVRVTEGIQELVAQMVPLLDGRALNDEQMMAVVTRYTGLRDEMRRLRTCMDLADGSFEVAQLYLTKMMEAVE